MANISKGVPLIYNLDDIHFEKGVIISFSRDIKRSVIKLQLPVMKRRGKTEVLSTVPYLIFEYRKLYKAKLNEDLQGLWKDFCRYSKKETPHQKIVKRRKKLEGESIADVKFYPYYYIFQLSRIYKTGVGAFGFLSALAVLCRLKEPGEYFEKSPLGSGYPASPSEVNLEIVKKEIDFKQKKIYFRIKINWKDILHFFKDKVFTLIGVKIWGNYKDSQGKTKGFNFQDIVCSFENPTLGVIEFNVLSKGTPLYKKKLFNAIVSGRVKYFRIGVQMINAIQLIPDYSPPDVALLPSAPSYMPIKSVKIIDDDKNPFKFEKIE